MVMLVIRSKWARATFVALALGSVVALVGCSQNIAEDSDVSMEYALATTNGLASINGLASVNGLALTNGLMTTDGGRKTVSYLVKCALKAGDYIDKQDNYGTTYRFNGSVGIAPQWKTGACDQDCQEWM